MDFSFLNKIPISTEAAATYFNVALTILIAILIDNIIRSLIKVPKHFDNRRARTFTSILRSIISFTVYAIALNIILVELGINVTPLLASAGIMGVIIGIGARAIIEDLLSGLFLLSQESIAVGDYIKIDDIEGYIQAIGFRTMTIKAESGALYILPNGMVKKIVNFSRTRSQVLIELPVKSDQKIDKALDGAQKAITLLEKDPEIGPSLFPGSNVDGVEDIKPTGFMIIRVTIPTSPPMRWKVGRAYRLLVKKEFEKRKVVFG